MGTPNNKNKFDENISSRKLNKNIEFVFDRGWSPVFTIVNVTKGYVFQLINWIGGEGDVPFDPTITTYYIGKDDFVTNINDAILVGEVEETTYTSLSNGWIGSIVVKKVGCVYTIILEVNGTSATSTEIINFSTTYPFEFIGIPHYNNPLLGNKLLPNINTYILSNGETITIGSYGNSTDIYYYTTTIIG